MMMNDDKMKLIELLDAGSGDDGEAEALRRRLAADPALQAEYRRMQALRTELRSARADSFAPFFAERVMRHLNEKAAPIGESIAASLQWVFPRAATVSLAAAVVLAGLNIFHYGDLEVTSSVVDALFGLPASSLMDALAYTGS